MLSKVEWPTAVVVIAGIAGLVTAAVLKVDRETVVAIGTAAVALAGAMKALLGAGSDKGSDGDKTSATPALPPALEKAGAE